MTHTKRLGIWMDHASAHIIEFSTDPTATTTVDSEFTATSRSETLGKSEHVMHNKEQHQQAAYYKGLGSVIKDYDKVLLFGPTDAKVELFKILRSDHAFEHVKIDVEQADKMTDNQQHAFVKEYFSRH